MRSPVNSGQKANEEKIDKLIVNIKEQQNYLEEIHKLHEENNLMRKENEELKDELKHLSNLVEEVVKNRRRNNIIISGLTIDSDIQLH